MRRTPIAHVIFPRPNAVRPVPEASWGAVQTLTATNDLDVDIVMPLPIRSLRNAHSLMRRIRGAWGWPEDIEEVISSLDPEPTVVPYLPLPRRSIESATAAICTALMRRPRAGRPRVVLGSLLDEGGYAAVMVGRVLGCPSIAVAHGSDVQAARGRLSSKGRQRRALDALRSADCVVAASTRVAQEIALLGVHADVLPFATSAEDFPQHSYPEQVGEVLYVGQVAAGKGVGRLIEAFAQIPRPDAILTLVGPMAEDFDLEGECARLHISHRVRAVGELGNRELAREYARSACVVLPSVSDGLSCVLVESLLVGRPVITTSPTTPVDGIERVDSAVGRTGGGDARSLACAIEEVLALGERGAWNPAVLRARVEPLTWEAVGPRLAQLTRDLMG